MLHRREYLARRIENLCHGTYLPVQVPAVDDHGKGVHRSPHLRIELHIDVVVKELEFGTAETEVLCHVHKMLELWNGKRDSLEEVNFKQLEAKSGDPTNKRFQVGVRTLEHIAVGNRKYKEDCENLQLGHG